MLLARLAELAGAAGRAAVDDIAARADEALCPGALAAGPAVTIELATLTPVARRRLRAAAVDVGLVAVLLAFTSPPHFPALHVPQ